MTWLPAPGPEADRDLPLDAHLHTNLSPDSDVPIDAYCAAAVERGIPEIAITDHVDFDPRAPDHSFASFATREREVREAAARWADRGLRVRFGIEVTYESHLEADIREHLARHPYDYAIGSVHVMAYSPYVGGRVAGWVAGRTFNEIVAPYFAEVQAAIRSEIFDTGGAHRHDHDDPHPAIDAGPRAGDSPQGSTAGTSAQAGPSGTSTPGGTAGAGPQGPQGGTTPEPGSGPGR